MSSRHLSFLGNINRIFIFTLTVAGLLMDGYQAADLLCTCALIIWLWMPAFTRLEAIALRYISVIDKKINETLY